MNKTVRIHRTGGHESDWMLGVRSALARWYRAQLGRELADLLRAIPQADTLGRRRALRQRQPHAPLATRAYRPRLESTTAVRAHVMQPLLGAVGAESALVRADASLRRVRWQISIAVFTVGAQLQSHRGQLPVR
jgi:hypothetical protein